MRGQRSLGRQVTEGMGMGLVAPSRVGFLLLGRLVGRGRDQEFGVGGRVGDRHRGRRSLVRLWGFGDLHEK